MEDTIKGQRCLFFVRLITINRKISNEREGRERTKELSRMNNVLWIIWIRTQIIIIYENQRTSFLTVNLSGDSVGSGVQYTFYMNTRMSVDFPFIRKNIMKYLLWMCSHWINELFPLRRTHLSHFTVIHNQLFWLLSKNLKCRMMQTAISLCVWVVI